MPAKKKEWRLTQANIDKIVALGKENPGSVKPVFGAFPGAREDVVRSVLSANGLTNSKPEVVEKDKAKVARLIGKDVTHHPRGHKSAAPAEESAQEAPEAPADERVIVDPQAGSSDAIEAAIAANKAEAKKTTRRAPRKQTAKKA